MSNYIFDIETGPRSRAELAECVHPHPSITEGVQECVRALLGKSILKPQVTGGQIQCRTVRPQVRSH